MLKVNSSHIDSMHYNEESQTLTVRFNNGSEWKYMDVPAFTYRKLMMSPSKGTHFAAHIKSKFLGKKVK